MATLNFVVKNGLTIAANGSLLMTGATANANLVNMYVTGTANLGAPGNIFITGGSTGQFLGWTATGNLAWATPSTTVASANALLTNVSTTGTYYLPFLVSGAQTTNGYYQAYSNANFSANLANGYISATGFTGSASGLTAIPAANVTGTLPNAVTNAISNVGTVTAGAIAGAIITGNVANANVSYYANTTLTSTGTGYISFTSGSASGNYALESNANFSANLANGYISATGFTGSASGLTAIPAANVTGTLPNAVTNAISNVGTVSAGSIAGALITGNVANANVSYYANTTLTSTGTGYIPFISATATGNYALESNANFSANLANGYISATGFTGSASGLTAIPAANVTGTLPNAVTNAISNVGTVSAGSIAGALITGNVANANMSYFANVTTNATTTAAYLAFANGSTTSNYALQSNTAIFANLANGYISATGFTGSGSGLSAVNAANVTGTFSSIVSSGNIQSNNTLLGNTLASIGTTTPLALVAGTTSGNITLTTLSNVNLSTQTWITNVKDPTNAQDAATKNYVDSVAQGLDVKPSVQYTTAAALPAYTYSGGVITATSNGILSVDGSTGTLAVGTRILVKNETSTNAPYNGIYTVTNGGAAGAAYVLTRALDMAVASEFYGAFAFTEFGSTNAGTGWICTSVVVTVGTTPVSFTQFSATGTTYTGANGIVVSGTVITVGNSFTVPGQSFASTAQVQISTTAAGGNGFLLASGNINALNIIATANLYGNANNISNIPGANVVGNVPSANVGYYSNVTTIGTGTTYYLMGVNASASGNYLPYSNSNLYANFANGWLTANGYIGNGSQLAGVTAVNANAVLSNVQTTGTYYLPFVVLGATTTNGYYQLNSNANFSANMANGYITATGYVGSASGLTAIPAANVTGTLPNAVTNAISNVGTVSAGSIAGALITGNVANANMSYYANVTGGASTGTYYLTMASAGTTGNYALASNANVNVALLTGTLSATLFAGSGANLTSMNAANITGTLANSVTNAISNVGTVTAGAIAGAIITGNVANANMAYFANVSTNATTASAYIAFANGSTTSNYALQSNTAIFANLANGYMTATGYVGNASGLTAIPAANVTGTLPNAVTNAISNVGTVSAGSIAGALITGNVANANMAYFANVSTNATTASAYIAFANGSTTSNYALQSNTAIFANLANGYMTATGFAGNVTGATGIFTTSANAPLINSGTSNITLTSGGNISVYTNANSTAQLVVANGATNVPGAYVAGTLYTGGSNTAYGGYSTTRANVAVTSASAVTIDQFANTVYRAAKYVITASGTNGYQAIEALVVHDGTTAYATLYGDIISNSTPGADVIDLTVSISSGNILVNAQANATFGSSANVRVIPMYVPV